MESQSDHLGKIGHGALTAVILPVGIGREARRGIEGEIRGHVSQALRIQRKQMLQPQDRISEKHPNAAEDEHGNSVVLPVLLAGRINSSGDGGSIARPA